MITALAGRAIGPIATLALLGYLAGFPAVYTAQYAVLAAYMQFATAPLNPYTEHFQLREILSGREGGLGAGLAGLALIWSVSAVMVLGLGQSVWVLAVVPLLGLGHLFLKVLAARLRANHRNGLALAIEFTLRPLMLFVMVILVFTLLGPSEAGLTWAFGLAGLATITVALAMNGIGRQTSAATVADVETAPASARSSPWAFIFLGMLMVLANQFEIFAMSRLADASALATYKVALQLASICGITANFVLMNNLRALYAHPATSDAYRATFRMIRLRTLTVSVAFAGGFLLIGLVWPVMWSSETWLLSAAAATIFSASAAFGPIGNWLYAKGRLHVIFLSLLAMLATKTFLLLPLYAAAAITPVSLMALYGVGVLMHNGIMYLGKRAYS